LNGHLFPELQLCFPCNNNNKYKKQQFINNVNSDKAKYIEGDITHHHRLNVNMMLGNITFLLLLQFLIHRC